MNAPSRRREGFTLIELLVVIAIIGVLVSMLLPAVQKVRAAAQRISCMNNLKQLGLAIHVYENDHGHLPPPHVKKPYEHGWGVLLLPYIEQNNLAGEYSHEAHWYDPANAAVVATPLRVMQCPSAQGNRMDEGQDIDKKTGVVKKSWKGAAADYFAVGAVGDKLIEAGIIGPLEDTRGVMTKKKTANKNIKTNDEPPAIISRLMDISDGASNTLLLSECAGRPQRYVLGKPLPTVDEALKATWASQETVVDIEGSTADGLMRPGPAAINVVNDKALYSFHTGGACAVFADGSVRFLRGNMSIQTLAALATRAGGETGVTGDY